MLMVNSHDFIIFLKINFGISDFGNWNGEKFGQYFQYTSRSQSSDLSLSSFAANIRYLNWHFFPILSLLIIPCSILLLHTYFKKILFLLLPYFFVISFFMSGNTGQHFASVFIWLIPFFCIFLSKYITRYYYLKILNIFFIILIIPFTVWAHIIPYDESNYPHQFTGKVLGSEKWPPNLNRPLKLISKKIKNHISSKDKIFYSIDGALTLHYLKGFEASQINYHDEIIVIKEDKCKKFSKSFKVLIIDNDLPQICLKFLKEKFTFENSKIKVYIFR